MRILATFPGRAGDLLWALPTVRALSEHFATPIDLRLAGEFASLVSLIDAQPYLGVVSADDRWALTPESREAPITPLEQEAYHRIYHLGYRGWPARALPFETHGCLLAQWQDRDGTPPEIDLSRPWITGYTAIAPSPWVEGWTETWFELKVGLSELLWTRFRGSDLEAPWRLGEGPHNISTSGRWQQEAKIAGCSWEWAARWILGAPVFLGDCSALHVLAVALGVPVVIVEPMEARENPIFYPLGMAGPQVTVVRGLDGGFTFDARHVAEVLAPYLQLESEEVVRAESI